jgi:hypothetical protein
VATKPAAFTAATKVVWSFEFTALLTISFMGYIASPPTITVLPFSLCAVTLSPVYPIASASVKLFIVFMLVVIGWLLSSSASAGMLCDLIQTYERNLMIGSTGPEAN